MKYRAILVIPFILPVLLIQGATCSARDVGMIKVKLQKALYSPDAPLWGMSNIFFVDTGGRKICYPAEWQDVRIAGILENKKYKPVYCVRFTDSKGSVNYVLDTDSNLDFDNEKILKFKKRGEVSIAGIDLEIQPVGNKIGGNYKMYYEIITSDDGYTYARIGEFREGILKIGEKEYLLIIRPGGRGHPCFDLTAATQCFIDLNGDGEFSIQWSIDENGEIHKPEQIPLSQPFLINGKKFQASEIDAQGKNLVFETTLLEKAASVGFKAPPYEIITFDGKVYRSEDLKGKIVLLEFWAVDCPYSEGIRPWVESIVSKYNPEKFIVLSIMIRPDEKAYKSFLNKYAMKSIIVQANDEIQKIYNPQTGTPVFYVIDEEGIIRFSGIGASVINVIEKLLDGYF